MLDRSAWGNTQAASVVLSMSCCSFMYAAVLSSTCSAGSSLSLDNASSNSDGSIVDAVDFIAGDVLLDYLLSQRYLLCR